jgi:DNA-binding response OmpR family regulator
MNVGLGEQRKTVLLVDEDPHARAVLRNALEAAGFSVGEAASAFEGERTARRIHPDAILTDVLMETHYSDETVERLRELGRRIPIYIVSSAADALVGGIGLRDLGVAGLFLKPVDPAIVVQTLRTRLVPRPVQGR